MPGAGPAVVSTSRLRGWGPRGQLQGGAPGGPPVQLLVPASSAPSPAAARLSLQRRLGPSWRVKDDVSAYIRPQNTLLGPLHTSDICAGRGGPESEPFSVSLVRQLGFLSAAACPCPP